MTNKVPSWMDFFNNTMYGPEKDGVRQGGVVSNLGDAAFQKGGGTDIAEGAALKGLSILGKKATAAAATMKGLGAIGMGALGAVAGPLAMILAIKGSQAKRKEKLRQEQNMLAIAPAATRFRA